MERYSFIAITSLVLLIAATVNSQTQKTPLDDYLDDAKTIFIGRCKSVGPVNILLLADVSLDVVQIVKGDEKTAKVYVKSRYGMNVGELYLVRIAKDGGDPKQKNLDYEAGSVIPVWKDEDLALLKTLSPRIVVLRTMNQRIDNLESEIRQRTWELEKLKAVKKDN